MWPAWHWQAQLLLSSRYDVILRHKLPTAIFHANSLSFPRDPSVLCCTPLTKPTSPFPQGCAVRHGILPGGQGVQVNQAGLEGLKGPFLQ